MTPEQEKHIKSIQSLFNKLSQSKYEKGVKEHGGNLWQVPKSEILDMAIEEAIDQVVYLLTLKQVGQRHD
jgi:hypothetical protein